MQSTTEYNQIYLEVFQSVNRVLAPQRPQGQPEQRKSLRRSNERVRHTPLPPIHTLYKIEEAIIGSDLHCTMDSLLFSVWREVIGASAEVRFGRMVATVKWDDGITAGDQGLLHLLNASKFGWCDPINGFVEKAKDEVRQRSITYGPVKGSETRRTTFVDRLCTQCVYCSPRPVDYSERLYDRFHLSAHNDGEYHFLHVQANYDKWQILYTRTAASQKPPLPTRKKRIVIA
ncbi:hypothetical protein AAVH_18090 [Aphelenchoides avenae]|nr:hypothetical protein AAVH_18090 [Aphelenchus avenae]